jgi:hypothetical protein
MGFGVCVLMVSVGASMVIGQYYGQVMAWRDEVQQIYYITHSSSYESALNSLESLSPYANEIANGMDSAPWPFDWLHQYAPYVRSIGSAGSVMRQLRDASEKAYYAISALELAPQYLAYAMIFGVLLVGSGSILVLRARARAGKSAVHSLNPPPPPPIRVCPKCGYVASPHQKFCSNCGNALS